MVLLTKLQKNVGANSGKFVYLKSPSLEKFINQNQGTFDFINKSKVLLGLESGKLESGRLEVVVYLKSTSELNCVINKNQGTFEWSTPPLGF